MQISENSLSRRLLFLQDLQIKKINMASAALIREIFTQPSPDDTDESRGRIPAAVNRLGTVLNGLAVEQDEDLVDDLFLASTTLLTAAALKQKEEEDGTDSDYSVSSVSSLSSADRSSVSSVVSSVSPVSSVSDDGDSDLDEGGAAAALKKAAVASIAATVSVAVAAADEEEDVILEQAMHDQSFDKNSRAPFNPSGPPVLTPWATLSEDIFKERTGGWGIDNFMAMVALLTLMPSVIVLDCGSFELAFGIFVLMRRWVSPVSWKSLSIELNVDRTRLIKLGNRTLDLLCGVVPTLCLGYLDLVGTLDYERILPLLVDWNEFLTTDFSRQGGPGPIGEEWVIGFVDGRCQPCTRPGTGLCPTHARTYWIVYA